MPVVRQQVRAQIIHRGDIIQEVREIIMEDDTPADMLGDCATEAICTAWKKGVDLSELIVVITFPNKLLDPPQSTSE